jgi:Protein of unknown function (DUF339).
MDVKVGPLTSISELRWRCRRGMLELDTVLTEFLESTYPRLEPCATAGICRAVDAR